MLDNPSVGFDYAPAYQVPALPWVTASLASGYVEHYFPFVTSFILFKNTSTGSLRIAFTRNGFTNGHSLTILDTESVSMDVRIKQLWVSGTADQEYSLLAGLTYINSRFAPLLTGSTSAPSGSVYWEGVG